MKKIIFIIPLLFFSSLSIACSCIGKSRMKSEIKRFDIVFTGKILSRKSIDKNDARYQQLTFTSVEYKVLLIEKLKGEIKTDTLTIYTGKGGGDCGVRFEIGKNYIIYSQYESKDFYTGNEIPKYLTTNICTRTSEYVEREYRKIKRYAKRKGYC